MNKVTLIGRLTKDIELRKTQSGKAVTSFSLAVDRRTKDEGADFISCVAWGTTAEAMNRFLNKGSKIAVAGRISVRKYEKDGKKNYVTEVVADEVEFLDSKREERSSELHEIENEDDLPF